MADPVSSRSVGRKRTKKYAADDELVVKLRLDGAILSAVDAECDRLAKELDMPITRATVIRRWLRSAANISAGKK